MFNQDISLENLKFYSGERFNLDSNERPQVTIGSKLPFNDSIVVNLNSNSKILKFVSSNNLRGFFGDINKMSIANSNGKHLILFDYGHRIQPTLFLFYKAYGGVFFILINSERPINGSIINILNLRSSIIQEK